MLLSQIHLEEALYGKGAPELLDRIARSIQLDLLDVLQIQNWHPKRDRSSEGHMAMLVYAH